MPYLCEWANHIRAGLHLLIAWVALALAINVFPGERSDPVRQDELTLVMLALWPPAFLLGAGTSLLRLRTGMRWALRAFRCARALLGSVACVGSSGMGCWMCPQQPSPTGNSSKQCGDAWCSFLWQPCP